MDANELARRQYLLGVLNRRMAEHIESLDDAFSALAIEPGPLTLLCACGREDCDRPLLTLSPEEFDRVREPPHRFVISPEHTTEIDEVVYGGEGFAIVEIKPQYRQENPATSDFP
jgi:hypothetical protein